MASVRRFPKRGCGDCARASSTNSVMAMPWGDGGVLEGNDRNLRTVQPPGVAAVAHLGGLQNPTVS